MRWNLILLLLAACPAPLPSPDAPGEGLFSEGCPLPNQALARQIGVDATLPGVAAVGSRGDTLLANEHVAFVITAPETDATYYYYDGIVADAVGMNGCEPASDDLVDEIALVVGQLDLGNYEDSSVRGFRGRDLEILSDGSDGSAAHVRVTGEDDVHWLVEYELIRAAVSDGGRPRAETLGVEIVVDYVLEPNASALRIDVTVTNLGSDYVTLFQGALLSLDSRLDSYGYPSDRLALPGIGLDYGMPWFLATDGTGALAWGVEAGSLAYTKIAGIDVAVDLVHATTQPFELNPGSYDTRTAWLSIGSTDGPSATFGLLDANPVRWRQLW